MKITPSYQEILSVTEKGGYGMVPVCGEILSDFITPIEAMRILKSASDHVFLLESAKAEEHFGRYTFLGYDPKLCISCDRGHLTCGELSVDTDDPASYLRKVLAENRSPRLQGMPPFTGGLMGYFSFESLGYSEPKVRRDDHDPECFRDLDLMLFDKVIAFDNVKQKLYLIANMSPAEGESGYEKALAAIADMEKLLKSGDRRKDLPGRLTGDFQALFDKESFCRMVEEGKHHIFEGDIFQIVLSNRLSAGFEGSLFNTYRMLRTINPSPYMFYFSGTDVEVAGASPETLVKLEDGVLHTFPLAGTRPRGKDAEEDRKLEEELLLDEKELAEHNMLVDLGRNDLGRISRFGTVEVEALREVVRFSHVMHIGSTVRGLIREDKDALDAVAAVLPAGTLSGAPKIRACQLIGDLEGTRRGIYGGAVGYIDLAGNMDTCIAIRLVYKKNDRVYVRSGAGIVADSDPEKEYEESLNKAMASLTALKMAQEVEE
ncbi:MAG: anthranilate synthase component I family protein [Lachnospiraceae bacterium]|nr:anthranilate synthase component I family protein [Lachnospiraceae bacterium]